MFNGHSPAKINVFKCALDKLTSATVMFGHMTICKRILCNLGG